MTLNKINNFSETRDAASFAKGIEARVKGASIFAAHHRMQAPTLKSSVAAVA